MKKKKKINKKKLFSRIFLLIALILLIVIIVRSFGKKDEKKSLITIILNNKDISEELLDEPYIDKDNVFYLSLEDIKRVFDSDVFYEESTNKIITTSGTKVCAIDVNSSVSELNSANIILPARNFKL